jgi:hypothetical protein
MPRGGKRVGAGGRFKWNHGKTIVVRIPESIAEKVLDYARRIDSLNSTPSSVTQSKNVCYDAVTGSKAIDLSGIVIRSHVNQPAVLLADLINAGYKITPDRLMQSPSLKSALKKQDRARSMSEEIKSDFSEVGLVYE